MEVHYFVEMDLAVPLRLWSGRGEQTFNGETYIGGGQIFKVGAFENTLGNPVRRMEIQVSVLDEVRLASFLEFLPPFEVTVKYVGRKTLDDAWVELPQGYKGRASTPRIYKGILTLELETYFGDIDYGDQKQWSHEDQMARFPGDKGLEYMRALEDEDVSTTWPP